MSTRECRIAMADGVELAATLYLPDPAAGPQPCILEALPYRKDDLTSSYADEYVRLRDEHGYAVCRLDLRGTGSSGGNAADEYPLTERSDIAAVIAWLAEQPWCDGAVGMYGTSYSGFNALQLACERPPALRAVAAIYASDDRWTDDVHWRGGQRKLVDLVDYCHYMTPMNALPPVPDLWGDGWREEWLRRIEHLEPWLLRWLRERTDGPYWRDGSVASDYTRIKAPVLLVAGWADGYRNNTFRTVEALRAAGVPHRLLAGPWGHAATDTARPGPRIDLVPELAAWWDRWLRGRGLPVDDGCDGRPAATVFVARSTGPAPDLDTLDGCWIREEWPSPRVAMHAYDLDGVGELAVRADTGLDAWIDCAGHLPWGQSSDQRLDDALSRCTELPLGGSTVLGQPVLRVRVSADAPHAAVAAKLCDVAPDGTSRLLSRGSLDLAFRESRTDPEPLEPGTAYDVELVLDACAHELAPDHRLRVSLAGTDWPNVVAPREPVTLTFLAARLMLPVWSGPSPHADPVLVPGAAQAEPVPDGLVWRVERDVLARTTACLVDHGSTYDLPGGGTATEHYRGRVSVDTRTFGQRAEADVTFTLCRPGAPDVSTRSTLDVGIDAESYDVHVTLVAAEGGRVVADRDWHDRLAR